MTRRLPRNVATLVLWYQGTLPDRVTQRMIAIGGYDRALALAAQAFGALFPLMLGLAAIVPQERRAAAVAWGLGLSDQAAAQLAAYLDDPVPSGSLTAVGAAVLVVSVLGFARTLQRTYLAAWDLPATGLRGYALGVAAAAAIVAELALILASGPLLSRLSDSLPLGFTVRLVVASLVWWPVQRVLLGGRVGWRALAPGAIVTGAGQAALLLVSSIAVPLMFSHETTRYGIAGVGVALVSWLVVFGWMLVVAALVGAELGRAVASRGDAVDPDDASPRSEPGSTIRGIDGDASRPNLH
ncbi:MAG: YhjD/YihY/BrkB family envelope integrity protein [Pseudonocardia sp.]